MQEKIHRLAAIVFTDIVGYTKRMEENEQKTMQLLQKQREIIFPLVESYGGKVIKEIGDGLMMMFDSAVQAVRFAISAQTRLKDEDLTIRAGIHIGEVIFKDGDVFGSAVNTAARIEPMAPANGICISDDVRAQLHNKSEIIAISIGRKDLKGVKEPVEIFEIFIEGVSEKRTRSVGFIFRDLWNRMVVQILAAYVLGAWIIKFAIASLVSRYMLSPHLVELSWVILLSLIPAVIILTYYHGKRSSARWTRIELLGLPANAFLSIILAIILFNGKDLGAATDKVVVENEDGVKVERLVVKSEFRKKIALFNFNNLTGDTTLNYLQYMVPFLTSLDLSQDIFITSKPATGFFKKFIDAGYPDGTGLPLKLMQRIAEGLHMNHFLTGEFKLSNGEFVLSCKLYETKYAKQVSEIIIENGNVFQLADEMSLKLKEGLGIPAKHINETQDLPIDEIFTNSLEALENYSYAGKESISNNWPEAIKYLEIAVYEDPEFAFAYYRLALFYFNVSQMENAQNALNKAMTYIDKVPERQQFHVKFLSYLFDQQAEKAIAVVKMLVELYPDDLEGRKLLAERYYYKNMKNEAIGEYKAVLETDPEQYDILTTLADIYLQMGIYDSALNYYEKFAGLCPQQYEAFTDLGAFYRYTGDMMNARENYDKALILAPLSNKLPILVDLADIEQITGEFDKALEQYQEALGMCKTASDSSNVYSALQTYYELKGQYDKALEYYNLKLNALEKYLSPKDLTVFRTFTIGIYVDADETEQALDILKELKKELEPPLDKVNPIGYMLVYARLGKAELAEQAMDDVEELAKGFGEEMLLADIYYSKGLVSEVNEEYQTAIENYTKYLEFQPTSFGTHRNIGRCYRKLGEYADAEKEILISLENRPFNPENNYEAALIYLEMDDEKKALEYLKRANAIWKDADADYKPAREAKETLEEISIQL